MAKSQKLIIHTDGGARGNPGPAGIGVVIKNEESAVLEKVSRFIGHATNNQAEYKAIIAALNCARELGAAEIDFYLDSELAVKQLQGRYKVKNKELQPLFVQVHNQSLNFKKINWQHVRRELNKEADALANEAMDRGN